MSIDKKIYAEIFERYNKHEKEGWVNTIFNGIGIKGMLIGSFIGFLLILPFLLTNIMILILPLVVGVIIICTCIGSTINYYEIQRHPNGILYKKLFTSKMYLFDDIESFELNIKKGKSETYTSQTRLIQGGASLPISKKRTQTSIEYFFNPMIKMKDGKIIQWNKKESVYIRHGKDDATREVLEKMVKWNHIFQFPDGSKRRKY